MDVCLIMMLIYVVLYYHDLDSRFVNSTQAAN